MLMTLSTDSAKPRKDRDGIADDSRAGYSQSEIDGSEIDNVEVDGGEVEVEVDEVGKKFENCLSSKICLSPKRW